MRGLICDQVFQIKEDGSRELQRFGGRIEVSGKRLRSTGQMGQKLTADKTDNRLPHQNDYGGQSS